LFVCLFFCKISPKFDLNFSNANEGNTFRFICTVIQIIFYRISICIDFEIFTKIIFQDLFYSITTTLSKISNLWVIYKIFMYKKRPMPTRGGLTYIVKFGMQYRTSEVACKLKWMFENVAGRNENSRIWFAVCMVYFVTV